MRVGVFRPRRKSKTTDRRGQRGFFSPPRKRNRKKFARASLPSHGTYVYSDLIPIKSTVFWGDRRGREGHELNRGPSMIRAFVGTNQGYRLPGASRSGCIVFPSSALLVHFLASCRPSRFLASSSLPPAALSSTLSPALPSSPSGLSSPRVEESRAMLASPPFLLLLLLSRLSFFSSSRPCVLHTTLFHAWPTARNRRSYRDYVHLECTHYQPGALFSSKRLSFPSLRDVVKPFHVELDT